MERCIVALLVAAVGCDAGRESSSVVRRDSAGVRIMESSEPRWRDGEGWRVDPQPMVDLAISGTGPAHDFHRVQHAARLRDGTIAVADRGSNTIRLFTPEGAHLRTLGREGEAPGEFRRLTSVHPIGGDSLLAFDYWQGRFTVYDAQGRVTRTFGSYDSNARIWRVAPLGDGTLVTVGYVLEQLVSHGLYRSPYAIVRIDPDGMLIDTIARIPGSEGFQFDRGDARPLFDRDGHLAARGARIVVGHADSMEITVHRPAGPVEMVLRVPGHDLRLSAADLRAERAAASPGPDAPAFLHEVIATMPDPETRPAYSTLLLDPVGSVWAPEYHGRVQPDRPTACMIFGSEGEWLGIVTLPARFEPFEIGDDYVLGVLTDAMDVEHVQLLRLDRRKRAP